MRRSRACTVRGAVYTQNPDHAALIGRVVGRRAADILFGQVHALGLQFDPQILALDAVQLLDDVSLIHRLLKTYPARLYRRANNRLFARVPASGAHHQ